MMYLQVQNLQKSFYEQQVLDQISFEVHSGDKVGLIGANGSGKTTLLKILLGQDRDYQGIVKFKEGLKIGYLRQNHLERSMGLSVGQEFLAEHKDWWSCYQKLQRLEEKLAKDSGPEVMDQYLLCHENFERLGGYQLLQEAELLFAQLGFQRADWERPYETLSGGQKTILVLGRILLEQPDFLILDEPTNHTDVETMQWLIKLMNHFSGVILLVSHDRYFLDQTVNKVFELEQNRLNVFPGNYSHYRREKDRLIQEEVEKYEKMKKEKKRLEKVKQRQMNWFQKAHQAAGTNDQLRRYAKKMAKRAKAFQARIDHMLAQDISKSQKNDQMNIDFGEPGKLTRNLISFMGVEFAYSGQRPLFTDLNFTIKRGDRLGIIGPNGTGKTTLLKLMVGELQPTQGQVQLNKHLQVGYFSQEMRHLELDLSPMEILTREGMEPSNARTLLGDLQLRGDEVFGPTSRLSMGERVRIVLARLMIISPDLLILDEPTNHLDISGRERLEETLAAYPGTFIVISHDRYLIRNLAKKLLVFDNQHKVQFYHGNYQEFQQADQFQNMDDQLLLKMQLAQLSSQLQAENLSEAEQERLQIECQRIQQELLVHNSGLE